MKRQWHNRVLIARLAPGA
jgi:hypothetical protein